MLRTFLKRIGNNQKAYAIRHIKYGVWHMRVVWKLEVKFQPKLNLPRVTRAGDLSELSAGARGVTTNGFVWLNTLNTSPRNWNFRASLILMTLASDTSQRPKPGPRTAPGAFPGRITPTGTSAKALVLNH